MTPPAFRFSVKAPRAITHDAELRRTRPLLERFFHETSGLGVKRGAILIQLPPSLVFDARVARRFFKLVRSLYSGHVVSEPRHESWFTPAADKVLIEHYVARVATDPTRIAAARRPGGWTGSPAATERPIVYYRLHGSPRKYWSRYPLDRIRGWADDLRDASRRAEVWCIFDNTAAGAAIENALECRASCRR